MESRFEKAMRKRLIYASAFLLLLVAEVLIGVFVHDAFIRPFVGDVLITVLLCCLVRVVFPNGCRWLPVWVLLFSTGVECIQLLKLPARLGLEGTVLGVLMGSTFDWKDLVCYAIGCGLFSLAEYIGLQRK